MQTREIGEEEDEVEHTITPQCITVPTAPAIGPSDP
jgi:hypothetical protein